jgi:WD40 repeat protein
LDYSPDGKLFATAGKNARILIYRSDTNSLYLEIEATDEETDDVIKAGHHQRVFALKFHPQHKDIFVTGGWDRAIKVWDLRTGGTVASIPGPYICGDSIDIQGSEILTGSWKAKDALQVWDMGSGKQSEMLTLGNGVPQFIYGIRFCDAGRVVAAGGSGTNSTHIIKRGSQEVLGVVSGGGRPVQALSTNRSGLIIASGGLGPKVHISILT